MAMAGGPGHRGVSRRADLRVAGWGGGRVVHGAGQQAHSAAHHGLPGTDRVGRAGDHSAVHTRGILPRRRQVVGAPVAGVPRVGGLATRRDGRCVRRVVRVFYVADGWFGSDDPCSWRAAAAGPVERSVQRTLLNRPADIVRLTRIAVSDVVAADSLRHHCESRDGGSVHRRLPARHVDAGDVVGVRHSAGHCVRGLPSGVCPRRGAGGAVEREVGDRASGRGDDGTTWRVRDAR